MLFAFQWWWCAAQVDVAGTSILSSFTEDVLQLSGIDSIEHYIRALTSMRYSNLAANPNTNAPRRIELRVTDKGGLESASATIIVDLSSIQRVGSDYTVLEEECSGNGELGEDGICVCESGYEVSCEYLASLYM